MRKKFKSVLCLLFFVVSSMAYAAGPYDGIWVIKWNGFPVRYATLNERVDNSVIIILLGMDESFWEAYLGRRDGNQIVSNTIVSEVAAKIKVDITSKTTLDAKLIECEPSHACEFLPGTRFTGEKLW